MPEFVYHPVFRSTVVLIAIIGLMVFCVDKSRQNRRTRNALYNCIYPLYVSAAVKAGDTLDLILAGGGRNLLADLLVAVAALAVYGWLIKPQADIPYNKLFYWVGWGALIFNAVARAAFLALQYMN